MRLKNLSNNIFHLRKMNLFLGTSVPAVAELQELMMVDKQLITPQKNSPVMGLVQDSLVTIRIMTQRNIFITRNDAMQILYTVLYNERLSACLKNRDCRLPVPAIVCSPRGPLWTGKQFMSLLFPKDLQLDTHSTFADDEFRDDVMDPHDTHVRIRDGELLTGTFDKKTCGSRHGSLVHIMNNDYGGRKTLLMLDGMMAFGHEWMMQRGFSVGLEDVMSSKETREAVKSVVSETRKAVHELGQKMEAGELEHMNNKSLEQTFEFHVNGLLNKARDRAGNLAHSALPHTNALKQMESACSKGNKTNIAQMAGIVGQQNLTGERIPLQFGGRAFPHCVPGDTDDIVGRGFVEHSYIEGLSPLELFTHAIGGREGLTDTACKSVAAETPVFIFERKTGAVRRVEIGPWIDAMLDDPAASARVERHGPEQKNLEYLDIGERSVLIPTADRDGKSSWAALTAVTRHDPGKVMYRITTQGGRSVIATDSNSMIVFDEASGTLEKCRPQDLVIGKSMLPVVANLLAPSRPMGDDDEDFPRVFCVETYLPKTDHIYGTDFNRAVKAMLLAKGTSGRVPSGWWAATNGQDFYLPYPRVAMLQRATHRSQSVLDGFVYPYHAARDVAIPETFAYTRENGVMFGLFLAEGSTDEKGGQVHITSNREDIRAVAQQWFEKFGIKHATYAHQPSNVERGTSTTISGYSTLLARLFKRAMGHLAPNKRVAPEWFVAPDEFVLGLLDGYISGDGSLSDNGITFSSTSEELVDGIALLLNRFGVFGSRSTFNKKQTNVTKNAKPVHSFSARAQFAQRLKDIITFTNGTDEEKRLALRPTDEHRNYREMSDVVLDKVKSVEELPSSGYPKVYDVTVPSTVRFCVANNLVIVDTADTGYLQRRLIKAMEDLYVAQDKTVRDSTGSIVQFAYGEDDMDGVAVENQRLELLSMSNEQLLNCFYAGGSVDLATLAEAFPHAEQRDLQRLANAYGARQLATEAGSATKRRLQVRSKEEQRMLREELVRMAHARDVLRDYVFRERSQDTNWPLPGNVHRVIARAMHRSREETKSADNSDDRMQVDSESASLTIGDVVQGLMKFRERIWQNGDPRVAQNNPVSEQRQLDTTFLFTVQVLSLLSPRRTIVEHELTPAAFQWALDELVRSHQKARVDAGESVGVLAGQSIGEPATQVLFCHLVCFSLPFFSAFVFSSIDAIAKLRLLFFYLCI